MFNQNLPNMKRLNKTSFLSICLPVLLVLLNPFQTMSQTIIDSVVTVEANHGTSGRLQPVSVIITVPSGSIPPTANFTFSNGTIPVTCSLASSTITIAAGDWTIDNATSLATATVSLNLIVPVMQTLAAPATGHINFTGDAAHQYSILFREPEDEAHKARITYLNAYNVEFGDAHVNNNYVGNFNIFAPSFCSISPRGESQNRWGFNAGFTKINYFVADSLANTSETSLVENVKIKPFDSQDPGTSYLHEINLYQTQSKLTDWSFYVQPLFRLNRQIMKNNFYAHLHAELLASAYTTETTIKNLQRDTVQIPPGFNEVMRTNIYGEKTSTYNKFLSEYFGGGLTFDLHPWSKGAFLIQSTLGYATQIINYGRNKAAATDKTVVPDVTVSRSGRWFYMVKASYNHSIGKDEAGSSGGSSIVIGFDSRNYFGNSVPKYAAYVGFNLGIEKVIKIINDVTK